MQNNEIGYCWDSQSALALKTRGTIINEELESILLIFSNMPKPVVQILLVVLLLLLAVLSIWTVLLCFWRPEGGRLFAPTRWAGTVAGIAVCAAFYQFLITRWLASVAEEFDDIKNYPYGPPSYITRSIIDSPDAPIQTSIRNFIFFDPSLAAVLGLWAGVFTVLSYWAD